MFVLLSRAAACVSSFFCATSEEYKILSSTLSCLLRNTVMRCEPPSRRIRVNKCQSSAGQKEGSPVLLCPTLTGIHHPNSNWALWQRFCCLFLLPYQKAETSYVKVIGEFPPVSKTPPTRSSPLGKGPVDGVLLSPTVGLLYARVNSRKWGKWWNVELQEVCRSRENCVICLQRNQVKFGMNCISRKR